MIVGYVLLLAGAVVLFAALRRRSMLLGLLVAGSFFALAAAGFTYLLTRVGDQPPRESVIVDQEALRLAAQSNEQSGVENLARKLDGECRQQIPVGSPKSEVISFLRAHGIEYHDEPGLRLVSAFVPEVRGQPETLGLSLTFSFDRGDRLVAHRIEVRGRAP